MSSATETPAQSDDASLFDELRHAQQPAYAEVGGPIAFLRRKREADIAIA